MDFLQSMHACLLDQRINTGYVENKYSSCYYFLMCNMETAKQGRVFFISVLGIRGTEASKLMSHIWMHIAQIAIPVNLHGSLGDAKW